MFNHETDVATISPNGALLDDEERFTVCFVETMNVAQEYLSAIYSARSGRGAGVAAIETDRDTLTDLEHGYGRALDRRRRELATLGGEIVRPLCVRGGKR